MTTRNDELREAEGILNAVLIGLGLYAPIVLIWLGFKYGIL